MHFETTANPAIPGRRVEEVYVQDTNVTTSDKPQVKNKSAGRFQVLYSWLGFQKNYNVPLCKYGFVVQAQVYS